MTKRKIILFGMTGMGNSALMALAGHPMAELMAVFSPTRQSGDFPYYHCKKIHDAAHALNIPLYEGLKLRDSATIDLISQLEPELIVVSGFNQIVPAAVIGIPKHGVINVHPSLLPKYRGSTPTTWTLLNDEGQTGVTVHSIEDERIDSGRILAQAAVEIGPYETDGMLRERLDALAGRVLFDGVGLALTRDRSEFPAQDEQAATYQSKRTVRDAEIDPKRPFSEIKNRIRAMTPYPGAYLVHEGLRYAVDNVRLLEGENIGVQYRMDGAEVIVKASSVYYAFHINRREHGNE